RELGRAGPAPATGRQCPFLQPDWCQVQTSRIQDGFWLALMSTQRISASRYASANGPKCAGSEAPRIASSDGCSGRCCQPPRRSATKPVQPGDAYRNAVPSAENSPSAPPAAHEKSTGRPTFQGSSHASLGTPQTSVPCLVRAVRTVRTLPWCAATR